MLIPSTWSCFKAWEIIIARSFSMIVEAECSFLHPSYSCACCCVCVWTSCAVVLDNQALRHLPGQQSGAFQNVSRHERCPMWTYRAHGSVWRSTLPASPHPASPHVPAWAGASTTGAAHRCEQRHVSECSRASAHREPSPRVQWCT